MKRIKRVLLILLSLFVITKVYAAPAVANNWKLYCEDVSVREGESTNCYLLTQIQNATSGGKNIQYINTGITGNKVSINVPYNAPREYTAYGMPNSGASTSQLTTNYGDPFNNQFGHRTDTCEYQLGCYDFYKNNGVILSDTTNPISRLSYNLGYTAVGYWKVYIDEDNITPDTDECARVCINVDYALEGETIPKVGVHSQTSNANATCQEIKLTRLPRCEYTGGKYYNKSGEEVTKEQYEEDCLPVCSYYNGHYYNSSRQEVTIDEYRADCLTCQYVAGEYYNQSGQPVTKEQYLEACFPACRCTGGKCYNTKHEEVTEDEYRKDCFSCKKDGNRYYDKDGKETTKEKYQQDCFPTCKCEGGKCYNKKHEEVTEEEYRKDCLSCKADNGKYYDEDGKEVTQEEFFKKCKPKCFCDSNQCYDDNGKPVTNEEYKKACACRIENGKYYDNNGNEVTKEEYYKACNPKCYCDKKQCYDNKGKPVDNQTYKKMCGCRKENGKFYDADGKEVTEKEWNAKCVPATGSFVKYIVLVALALMLFGLYNLSKIYRGKKKIYKV